MFSDDQERPEPRCEPLVRHRGPTRWLLGTFVAWAICFVGAARLIRSGSLPEGATPWLVAILPTVAGLLALGAYQRWLRATDELLRMIQLQALAIGFGVTWLAISGYPLFVHLGAPALDIGDYAVVMAMTYSVSVVVGAWRYR